VINKNDMAWLVVTAWIFGVAIGMLMGVLVKISGCE